MNKQRYFWYTRVLKSMFWSITLSQSNWEKKCKMPWSQKPRLRVTLSLKVKVWSECTVPDVDMGSKFTYLSLLISFFFFDWGICAIASARLVKHQESEPRGTKSKSPLREKRQIESVSLSTFIRQQTGTVNILLNLSHHFKIIPTEIVVNWLI